ncbi:MAG: DUF2163 domain-containing protein [Gammaproteobacteria bacterium]|nr:DUF2163 domain-containing protein [Gammaproteobacteria bacterium]
MKTISGGLLAHNQGTTTTHAWMWKITRLDGLILAFTSFSDDLMLNGITYKANVGSYTATAIRSTSDLAVDNLDLNVLFSSEAITEADLLSFKYDYAQVQIGVVNYADLALGFLDLRDGYLGEVSVNGAQFTAELRGLTQLLQQSIGRKLTKRCSADFCDAECGLNPATFTVTGTVTAVASKEQITVSVPPSRAGGLLTFTSGANNGGKMEVKTIAGAVLNLYLPMPFAIAVGDSYSALAGCDHLFSTCRDVYNNVVNFRGFPDMMSSDQAYAYPDAR